MHEPKLTQSDLDQFTGSDNWTRCGTNRSVLYSDGVAFMAEKAGAYWLLDIIACAQLHVRRVAAEEFQVWTLKRNRTGNGATVICDNGNRNVVHAQNIHFTDFPLPEVKLYFENNVICLPSER